MTAVARPAREYPVFATMENGNGHGDEHHERRLSGIGNHETGLPGTGHWRRSANAQKPTDTDPNANLYRTPIDPPRWWIGYPFIRLNSQLPQNRCTNHSFNKGLFAHQKQPSATNGQGTDARSASPVLRVWRLDCYEISSGLCTFHEGWGPKLLIGSLAVGLVCSAYGAGRLDQGIRWIRCPSISGAIRVTPFSVT